MIYRKKVVRVPAPPPTHTTIVERPVVVERDRWWWEGSGIALILGALALVGLIVYFALANNRNEGPDTVITQPAVIREEERPSAEPPVVINPPPTIIQPPVNATPSNPVLPEQRVIIEGESLNENERVNPDRERTNGLPPEETIVPTTGSTSGN